MGGEEKRGERRGRNGEGKGREGWGGENRGGGGGKVEVEGERDGMKIEVGVEMSGVQGMVELLDTNHPKQRHNVRGDIGSLVIPYPCMGCWWW